MFFNKLLKPAVLTIACAAALTAGSFGNVSFFHEAHAQTSQLFEKGRRNPKRQCQTIRAQIVGLAGVFGRYKWVVAIRHDVCTLGQFRRKRRPLFKHVFDRLDVLGVQIHDQKVNVFLRGRDNPCLMRTVKRMRLLGDGVVIDRRV